MEKLTREMLDSGVIEHNNSAFIELAQLDSSTRLILLELRPGLA